MENHSIPRKKSFQSSNTGWKKGFLVFFHKGRQEQLKSVQYLRVDKSVLTDQKTWLLLDMPIILSSSILCVAVQEQHSVLIL